MSHSFMMIVSSAHVAAAMASSVPYARHLSPAAVSRLGKVRHRLSEHRGVLLVDGNNVRAASGFRYDAREMQTSLDAWAAAANYSHRMCVVWDHGEPTSFVTPSSYVLLSGNEQTADDVIVQATAFLSCDANELLVVTSDKSLRGRCHTQHLERSADGSVSDARMDTMHAVDLSWLLEMDEEGGWRTTDALRERYSQPHRCRTERTQDRAEQATALMQTLQRSGSAERLERRLERSPSRSILGDSTPLGQLASWYADGTQGLRVARESRRGNPVYALRTPPGARLGPGPSMRASDPSLPKLTRLTKLTKLSKLSMRASDPPPPELDERQADFMRRRGFEWSAKRRAWVTGDPSSAERHAERLECRSAARVLRWEGDPDALAPPVLSAVRAATRRLEQRLREARERALEEKEVDRRVALRIKDHLMKPYAPALWLLVQLSVLAALVDAGCAHGSALGAAGAGTGSGAVAGGPGTEIVISGTEIAISGTEIAIGLAFAPLLAALRRERWVRQPGVEDGDGALERVLVDAVLGSHALPAPWEWRCVERAWGRAVLVSESLAALNTALFWHGGVQAAVLAACTPAMGELGAACLGVLAIAAAAAARAVYFEDPIVDGIPAEVGEAKLLASRAETYYGMTASSAAEAAASVAALHACTDGWVAKFGRACEARTTLLLLCVASAVGGALAYELAGHSALAPAFALCFSAVDTYVLRPQPELTRVTLALRDLETRLETGFKREI